MFQLASRGDVHVGIQGDIGFYGLVDNLFQGKPEIGFPTERIISPAHVVREKGKWVGDTGQLDPMGENVIEGVDRANDLVKYGKIFPEGKSLHFMDWGATAKVATSFVNVENGGAGKSDLHVGVGIVELFQFS